MHEAAVGLKKYPPIRDETREIVPTDCAAHHLNRSPHTMHLWAHAGKGPIQPLRINGRLAWRTADIKRLLGVAA